MFVLASVTDSLVTFANNVIRDLGLPGVFLLVAADALGVPIAAAAIMLFAGFTVSEGHHTIGQIVIAGTLGDVVGSLIAYAIGATGGHELLERHGRKLHITPAKLDLAHRWFERRGALVVGLGRLVPFVRTYIAYPAGVARMSLPKFAAATAAGGFALSLIFGEIGKSVGKRWEDWRQALGYVDYAVVALLLLAAVVLFVRWRRTRVADAPA